MAESKKMDEDELLAHIEQEESACVVHFQGELSDQRRLAMDYYLGKPYGNEVEGRSQVVTTEVKDAVEGILPPLMAIFTAGDEIVRFEPQNPEDEEKAQQATDYINYIFSRQNNGFLALYSSAKDALLQKNGYVKVYWEEYEDVTKETYENLDDMGFLSLTQDQELELIEHTERDDPYAAQMMEQMQAQIPPQMGAMLPPPPKLHDAKFKRTKSYGKVCIDPIPPEETLVSRETTSDLNKARFVEHRTLRTISEIREMGYEIEDDIADETQDADLNGERIARLSPEQSFPQDLSQDTNDPSTRRVWLCEAYLRVDYDGDGIAELRKVTKVGKTILDNEEFDSVPIIGGTFIPMPHKHFGLSIYDLIGDLQLQKSTVLRQLFDNAYVANNGRMEVLDGMVNMSDLLTSRPNGIVRTKVLGAVKRIDNPLLGAPFYNLLEYLDKLKVNRVGARDFGDAVDPNALNAKAHTAELVSNASQERINLMARVWAETFVKNIFWKILELVCKHQDKPQQMKLSGKWVQIDPREWKDRFNMTVTVGLGTGSQQAKLQSVMALGQLAQGAIQAGLAGRVVTEENIFNLLHIAAKATFPKEADMLFTNPKQLPPPQPQPDPEMLKLQLQKEKQDAAVQMKQMKMQMDQQMEQFRAAVQNALQERDHQAQAQKEQFKAMVDRVSQESEQRTLLAQEQIKAAAGEHQVALKGTLDSVLEAQRHHQTKVEQLLQGVIDVKVEKSKPKQPNA